MPSRENNTQDFIENVELSFEAKVIMELRAQRESIRELSYGLGKLSKTIEGHATVIAGNGKPEDSVLWKINNHQEWIKRHTGWHDEQKNIEREVSKSRRSLTRWVVTLLLANFTLPILVWLAIEHLSVK